LRFELVYRAVRSPRFLPLPCGSGRKPEVTILLIVASNMQNRPFSDTELSARDGLFSAIGSPLGGFSQLPDRCERQCWE